MSRNSMLFSLPRSAMLVQLIAAFSVAKIKAFSSLLVRSVCIFCRVLTLIRYIEVDFTFGLPHYARDYVRYIEVLFHTFHCNFGQAEDRGLGNRGSTVSPKANLLQSNALLKFCSGSFVG